MQFTFIKSNFSQSSIAMSTKPLLDTTKKLDSYSTLLCLIITLHMLTCGMQDLLYAHHTTFLFMQFSNWGFGNRVLNTLMDIQLLSLPVLTLQYIIEVFGLAFVFNLVISTDMML